jgi:hypothetical protein
MHNAVCVIHGVTPSTLVQSSEGVREIGDVVTCPSPDIVCGMNIHDIWAYRRIGNKPAITVLTSSGGGITGSPSQRIVVSNDITGSIEIIPMSCIGWQHSLIQVSSSFSSFPPDHSVSGGCFIPISYKELTAADLRHQIDHVKNMIDSSIDCEDTSSDVIDLKLPSYRYARAVSAVTRAVRCFTSIDVEVIDDGAQLRVSIAPLWNPSQTVVSFLPTRQGGSRCKSFNVFSHSAHSYQLLPLRKTPSSIMLGCRKVREDVANIISKFTFESCTLCFSRVIEVRDEVKDLTAFTAEGTEAVVAEGYILPPSPV